MSELDNLQNNSHTQSSSILDTIMGSQTQTSLAKFEPSALVSNLLDQLKERDREILQKRFGLNGVEVETLEAIGKKFNLTRERVRQIEKDGLISLRQKGLADFNAAIQMIFDMIVEHGNIISEDFLIQTLLINKSTDKDSQAIKFFLNLGNQFEFLKEDDQYLASWYVVGFSLDRLQDVLDQLISILNETGKVMSQENLVEKFRHTEFYKTHFNNLGEKVIRSYLNISKVIQINPFGEIGLKDWVEVKPHDVGDKSYLVLKHHGKGEHYSVITKLINDHKFDSRMAFKETVHNELIKDSRFVLIGRGIYALTEWGYKKGVVAEVIREILTGAGGVLSRDQIIAEVLKKRQVKRNTILVGLSNKKNFTKVDRDKYIIAEI